MLATACKPLHDFNSCMPLENDSKMGGLVGVKLGGGGGGGYLPSFWARILFGSMASKLGAE